MSLKARGWVPDRWEAAVLILIAAACSVQLFGTPPVGVANNGDYWRLEAPLGLRVADPLDDIPFGYVQFHYKRVPPLPFIYGTSEYAVARIAIILGSLFSAPGTFDLRALGAVHLFLYLFSIWLLLIGIRAFPIPVRFTAMILMLIVFTDVSYVSYLNSIYSEPAAFIFCLGAIGSGLILATQPPGYLPIFLFALNFGMCASSKVQHYPLGIFGVIVGILLFKKLGTAPYRIAMFASTTLAIVGTFLVYRQFGGGFGPSNNQWQSVYASILPVSPAPEQDLKELGLPAETIKYKGLVSFKVDHNVVENTVKDMTRGTLLAFYLHHPDRYLAVSRVAADRSQMRVLQLGNFEKAAGRANHERSSRFSLWSDFKQRFYPRRIWFFWGVPLLSMLLIGGAALYTSDLTWLFAMLIPLMTLAEFMLVVFGEGVGNPEKQLHLFHFNFEFCLAILILTPVWFWISFKSSERESPLYAGRPLSYRAASPSSPSSAH